MIAPTGAILDRIARLARSEAGLNLDAGRSTMIHARLRRRLRSLDLPDYQAYCDFLDRATPQAAQERKRLVEALTTNVTSFFREPHHFRSLIDNVRGRAHSASRPLRILSAGCSDGSEPVSILLALRRALPLLTPDKVSIEGIDIDEPSLDIARGYTYPAAAIPTEWTAEADQLLERVVPDHVALPPEWRRSIHYRLGNLANLDFGQGEWATVFCRNVTIYFDPETAGRVQASLADALADGGLICLGHSERLMLADWPSRFRRIGTTTYRKEAAPCR